MKKNSPFPQQDSLVLEWLRAFKSNSRASCTSEPNSNIGFWKSDMCGVSSDIDTLPSRKEEKSHGKGLPSCPHISDFQASRHQLADPRDHLPAHDIRRPWESRDSPDWFPYHVRVPLWDCPRVHHLSRRSRELQGAGGFHAASVHNNVILGSRRLLLSIRASHARLSCSILHYHLTSLLRPRADVHFPKGQSKVLKSQFLF